MPPKLISILLYVPCLVLYPILFTILALVSCLAWLWAYYYRIGERCQQAGVEPRFEEFKDA